MNFKFFISKLILGILLSFFGSASLCDLTFAQTSASKEVDHQVTVIEEDINKEDISKNNINENNAPEEKQKEKPEVKTTPTVHKNHDTLSLENEFIKLIVNNQTEDKGRFSIETTKGTPHTLADDNQLLIFGRPIPWTSYTSIYIDGEVYIFGGPDKKVSKRSGLKQHFGTVLSQKITEDGILTSCQFNDIIIKQHLSLMRNPSTRVKDSALISYEIINTGTSTHNVGIRLMLDTKLGTNDGAPFRIGKDAITSEIHYSGKNILDYWQTFDNLSSPNIVAQGTLFLPEKNISPPNRLYLANWGTLVDHPWDFNYKKGRSFIRSGELDKDTALALYWDPTIIKPGEEKAHKTAYGLGGLTMMSGELTIGITAPAEVSLTSKKDILIVAYILNSGGFDSENTMVYFDLPEGFNIKQGSNMVSLETLKAGETKQIPITVSFQGAKPGKNKIKVRVSSSTLTDNEISRHITLLGNPKITSNLAVTYYKDPFHNQFADVFLTLSNPNRIPLVSISSQLLTGEGVSLPKYEPQSKLVSRLNKNKQTTLHWKIQLDPKHADKKPISTLTSSLTTGKKVNTTLLKLPKQKPEVGIQVSKKTIERSDYLYAWVYLSNKDISQSDTLSIQYDPDHLDYIRFSPESWLLLNKTIGDVQIEKNIILLKNITSKKHLNSASKTGLYKIHFLALKTGKTSLSLYKNGNPEMEVPLLID